MNHRKALSLALINGISIGISITVIIFWLINFVTR